MTAADIGYTTRSIPAQASFIANPVAQVLRNRPTVKAVNPRDGRVRHGMFLGTGAVSFGHALHQVSLNDRGVKGNAATFLALAGAVGKSIFSAPIHMTRTASTGPFPSRSGPTAP